MLKFLIASTVLTLGVLAETEFATHDEAISFIANNFRMEGSQKTLKEVYPHIESYMKAVEQHDVSSIVERFQLNAIQATPRHMQVYECCTGEVDSFGN